MKRVKISNRTRGTTIIARALMTENFIDRFMGLMFKRPSPEFSALVIDRCESVHTFFMRFNLDLVFLDREGVVLRIINELKPFRISPVIVRAYYVIEMAAGRLNPDALSIGDIIEFEENWA